MADTAPNRFLMYFADPMCSWCWGFAPAIDNLLEEFADILPLRLVLGGLRPAADGPMDEAARTEMRNHWEEVRAASGQAFNFDFFDWKGFVYNTESRVNNS